jgi:hypothetical protein
VAQTFSNLRGFRPFFPLIAACLAGMIAPAAFTQDAEGRADDARVSVVPRIKATDNDAKQSELERRPASIRIDTTLVQIPVTVTDPLNRFVTGLEKEHFKVFEGKVEQTILQFSSEDAPLSVGLVFDTSGSMGPKLQKSRQAAVQFFKTANPEDESF